MDIPITIVGGYLGAGKTTLVRGFLTALGHQGAVKSPTYTVVESYGFSDKVVHHFDLYRITDPEEIEYLGLDEYFHGKSLCLVEWPERGEGFLPDPLVQVALSRQGDGREAILTVAEKDTEILDFLGDQAVSGDVVAILSNGGFDNIHERLLERLTQNRIQ